LDNNIDENNKHYQNTINQLQHVVNTIYKFTDGEKCIEFINSMNDENICMIIEDSLGQQIVPYVHNMPQMDSIFIFSADTKQHEQWTKNWFKIKGVFTEISQICEAVKRAAYECTHNVTHISFITTNDDMTNKNLNQLDCSFMYTQIMKEIILDIEFKNDHIEEFFKHCCNIFENNKKQPITIKEVEQKYRSKTPIWWYSWDTLLYTMLNCALRQTNADVIIKMGFFIGDLHRQIKQLHHDQFIKHHNNEIFNVYRGQGLLKVDFELMKKTKGGLMSFNNFLSTSRDRDVSYILAESNGINPDMVGILFIMKIDPSKSTTPFASIKAVSNFNEEDEILFSMHSVFRIHDIKPFDGNQNLFQVDLTLTTDNDKDLQVLTKRIREEIDPESEEWYRLGKLLLKIDMFDKAQQVYDVLLQQAANDIKRALIYYHIGCAKYGKGEYEEAITAYEKAIKIQQTLPSNDPDLAKSYNGIGAVYQGMADYSKALSSYKKALDIRQNLLPPNPPDLAASYNNIGIVYHEMSDYSSALSSYEKALEIRQKSLPPNHPDLAASYNNIGTVHHDKGDYSNALSSYENALGIRQKSLLPNHSHLAESYNNIGTVYHDMDDYSKALSSHEKALEIQQQSIFPNHPDLAKTYNNIGNVYSGKCENSKAFSFHEKALEFQQKSLSLNHPDLAKTYISLANIYVLMSEHLKGIPLYMKALKIQQQSLSPNHPDVAMTYNNIGLAYEKMGKYYDAREFYQHALDIGQNSLQSNHPRLQNWRKNLDTVKRKCNQHLFV
jgi:tetratricopeptide (TPR) repeat protein